MAFEDVVEARFPFTLLRSVASEAMLCAETSPPPKNARTDPTPESWDQCWVSGPQGLEEFM